MHLMFHTNMTFLDFVISTLAGFASSIIFIYFLLRFYRPKIIISDCIAHDLDEKNERCYRLKILNKSFHYAFDVIVKLDARLIYSAENDGLDTVLKSVALHQDSFSTLEKYKS